MLKSSQSCAVRKKIMIDDEQPSNDILAQFDISSTKLSQMATIAREDDVKDCNDDDIGMEMNKQVPLDNLSSAKIKLNND
jgi:hypothetical protein